MKISSINCAQNNYSFNNKFIKPVETRALRPMNTEDKVVLSAKCISAIGVVGAANIILKENGLDLFKIAKSGLKFIK